MTFGKVKIDEADRLFSLFVRTRDNWECQRCRTKYPVNCGKALQNSHFWGRGNESTRFDPENCTALCHGCHALFTANPEMHRHWMLGRLGPDNYKALMVKKYTYKKRDRRMELIIAKKLLEQVCAEKGLPYLG